MKGLIQKLGMKKYLNRTREVHRGYGFNDFEGSVKLKMSKTAMALMFGVSRNTMNDWVARYNEEYENNDRSDV